MSLRDVSEEVTQKEIVEIQSRYARLVLNMPVKKKEEAPPPKVEEKKKEEIKKEVVTEIKIEPIIEEIAPIIEEEIKPEEIVPDLAEIETRLASKYDIKKETVELDVEEDSKFALGGGPDIPDINTMSRKRYNTKGSGIELEDDFDKSPAIGAAANIPDIGAIAGGSRYGSRKKTKLATIGAAIDISDDSGSSRTRRRTRVLSAPDVKIGARRTYGTKRMSRQIDIADDVAPKMPKEEVRVAALPKSPVFKPPEISTKYGRRKSKPAPTIPTPELAAKKVAAPALKTQKKKRSFLPETAGIQHLSACVDPAEESRLKRQIISRIDEEGQYCENSVGKFEFINVEMVTTLDIRFVSNVRLEQSRCEALRLALQCLMK